MESSIWSIAREKNVFLCLWCKFRMLFLATTWGRQRALTHAHAPGGQVV